MSQGTKELKELLRAGSSLLVEYLTSVEDGEFGFLDKVKFIGLIPEVYYGIKGSGKILDEAKDLDPAEKDELISEIKATLMETGKFTHREADMAEAILSLVYLNVVGISNILSLPPSALPA